MNLFYDLGEGNKIEIVATTIASVGVATGSIVGGLIDLLIAEDLAKTYGVIPSIRKII